ncbi:MAG: hypothetical protein KAV87_01185 [Desulfobacteraceae bacterium]|nr:hypothetical protein [Desulfobacteraceae bacterium]
MVILFSIVGLVLLVAGGAGLVLTYANFPLATLDWIEGNLTYGVFTILGIAVIILATMIPRET